MNYENIAMIMKSKILDSHNDEIKNLGILYLSHNKSLFEFLSRL